MEIFTIVGKIAGIGGLSLGIFFLLFKEIIRKNIFPRLEKQHAYKIITLISILIWSIAIIGVTGWFIINFQG